MQDDHAKTHASWMTRLKSALQENKYPQFLQSVSQETSQLPCQGSTDAAHWLEELANALRQSFEGSTQLQRLAFLAYNGKVEGAVRDEVLWQLTKRNAAVFGTPQLWFGREFRYVDGVKGPGDEHTVAQAAFQAKQMCAADVLRPSNPLLRSLNLDMRLLAPRNLNNRSPSVQVGLLLVLDPGETLLPDLPSRGYPWLMKKQSAKRNSASPWQPVLRQRLSQLQLAIESSGSWTLWEHHQGGLPFAMHWFLLTPSPFVDVSTSDCDANRRPIPVA